MPGPVVIDLSHHNPDPDWEKVFDAGVLGVILKATESTSFVDKTLYRRTADAWAAGLRTSTYHFLRPSSIEAQMDHYLQTVEPRQGERLCIDHEDERCSLGDVERAVLYLKEKRPDVELTIYSGHLIKEQLGSRRSAVLADNTSLWIAQYTTAKAPKWPKATWPAWSLWQYTDAARVPGISKPVDGNNWNGSGGALLSWFGPATVVAPPAQPIETPVVESVPVVVNITLPPGIEVHVTINGREMETRS